MNIKTTNRIIVFFLLALLIPGYGYSSIKENICSSKSNQVVVRFTYGLEKRGWIYEATEKFNQSGIKTSSGKTVCVNAIAKESGKAIQEIYDGQAGPQEVHATSPDTDIYVNYFNEINPNGDFLIIQDSLASSPMVISVWESKITELGNRNEIGWKSIYEQTANNSPFRLKQSSPLVSSLGLTSLVSQYFAGVTMVTRKSRNWLPLRYIQNKDISRFVAELHKNVMQYGDSTTFLTENMQNLGPAFADAAVLSESDVIAINKHNAQHNSGFPKLIAVYPVDGMMVSNHPFAIVSKPWVDAEEREGAGLFSQFLRSAEVQADAPNYGFRPAVPLDLKKTSLKKLVDKVWSHENGVKPYSDIPKYPSSPAGAVISKILDTFPEIKKASQIYVVFDVTGSMDKKYADPESKGKRRIEVAKDLFNNQLVKSMSDKDQISLFLFSDDTKASNLTKEGPVKTDEEGKAQVENYLFPKSGGDGEATPGGRTRMLDAITAVHDVMCDEAQGSVDKPINRFMLVVTDGKDSSSDKTGKLDQLVQQVGVNGDIDPQCKFPVYGISFSKDADASQLKILSAETGGDTVAAKNSLSGAFDSIKDAIGGVDNI